MATAEGAGPVGHGVPEGAEALDRNAGPGRSPASQQVSQLAPTPEQQFLLLAAELLHDLPTRLHTQRRVGAQLERTGGRATASRLGVWRGALIQLGVQEGAVLGDAGREIGPVGSRQLPLDLVPVP